ncbi:MAG: hypothetical protein LPD71_10605 [Shewanella sp.]|nr:hypothetical protein [Shewanella sp.]
MRNLYEVSAGEIIATEGKTLCSSYSKDERQATIHMVNVFAFLPVPIKYLWDR